MKCSKCGKDVSLVAGTGNEDNSQPVCDECAVVPTNAHEEKLFSESKPKCRNHPGVEADFKCLKCDVHICKTCVFPQSDGTSLCADCIKKSVARTSLNPAPSIPEGTMCLLHPGVPAVQLCQMCNSHICKTCDFEFPDNIHVCPNCVNKPLALSDKQKKNLVWSYVMAGLGTLSFGLIFFFAAIFGPDIPEQVAGIIFMVTVLGSSITGLAFAINARPRNRKKNLAMWVPLIWNSLIIGLFFVLVIIGNMMR